MMSLSPVSLVNARAVRFGQQPPTQPQKDEGLVEHVEEGAEHLAEGAVHEVEKHPIDTLLGILVYLGWHEVKKEFVRRYSQNQQLSEIAKALMKKDGFDLDALAQKLFNIVKGPNGQLSDTFRQYYQLIIDGKVPVKQIGGLATRKNYLWLGRKHWDERLIPRYKKVLAKVLEMDRQIQDAQAPQAPAQS